MIEQNRIPEYQQRPRIPLVPASNIRVGDALLRNDLLELVKRVEREPQTTDQARERKPDVLVWFYDRPDEPMHYTLSYQVEVWRPLGGEVR